METPRHNNKDSHGIAREVWNCKKAAYKQMRVDEAEHGEAALDLGGAPFPAPVRALMAASAKLMTETTYRL